MSYDVTKPPVLRTSEASRTTAEDMNRMYARINHMLEYLGVEKTVRTDWDSTMIVGVGPWRNAIDYVIQYASGYTDEITYSTHYRNLNNIELACYARVYQEGNYALPFNLQEGYEWQI